ncbi:MAG: hypothetical protein QW279_15750 [Candidatus Jordarchaeaceae archaeon]
MYHRNIFKQPLHNGEYEKPKNKWKRTAVHYWRKAMKKIIALIIAIITISIGIYSQVDDLNTAVEVIDATSPAFSGDYQAATTNVVNFSIDYIVGAVYFAVAMMFVTFFIGILKKAG